MCPEGGLKVRKFPTKGQQGIHKDSARFPQGLHKDPRRSHKKPTGLPQEETPPACKRTGLLAGDLGRGASGAPACSGAAGNRHESEV